MRTNSRRILALFISLVLLLCIAPASFAEGLDLETANTVKINLVPSDASEDFASDIRTAKVQADLYLLAEAEADEDGFDTYHYVKLTEPFSALQKELDTALVADEKKPNDQDTVYKAFAPLAQKFADIVLDAKYTGKPAVDPVAQSGENTTIQVNGLKAGLYLLILHGSDLQKTGTEDGYVTVMPKKDNAEKEKTEDITATRAKSADYEYFFEPQLLTLPTKVDEKGNQQYNTAYGEWTHTLEITVKAERESRTGKLIITKSLNSLLDLSKDGTYVEPATFTFDVIARETEETSSKVLFRRQVTINFTATGTQSETIEGIPIGSYVWVEEMYQGSHYKGSAVDPTADQYPVQMVAAEGSSSAEVTVEFANTDTTIHRGGHGIENVFTYGDNGWVWSSDPGGEHAKADEEVVA